MEMSNIRVESHVSQKGRGEKLRFEHNSELNSHLDDYTSNHLGQFPVHHRRPELISLKYGSIPFDPNVFPSDMLNSISRNPQLLLPHNSRLLAHHESSSSQPTWTSNPSYDHLGVIDHGQCNTDAMVVGDGLSSSLALNTSLIPGVKPSCVNGYPRDHRDVVHPSSVVPPREVYQNAQKHYGEMHFGPSHVYQQSGFQEVVETEGKNESRKPACFLSGCVNQGIPWTGDQSAGFHRAGDRDTNVHGKNTQGLSLSLSSVPQTRSTHESRVLGETARDGTKQNMTGGNPVFAHRNVGPLGPFTGYATILKNSKYLKPAQQLLNECCNVSEVFSRKIVEEEVARVSSDGFNDIGNEPSSDRGKGGGDSGASCPNLNGANEGVSGGQSSCTESSYRPEFQQKKVKLLCMQDEVCRRYKQYHQQMQLVISSFETVAGLSTAAPYVSLALKTVSRHFRCVKNAILEQLAQTRRGLGEGSSDPATTTTSTSSRLRLLDPNFHKPNRAGGGFFGTQQPAWRPQRGLPERAVSLLKAWLFDHFLHPLEFGRDLATLSSASPCTAVELCTQRGLAECAVSDLIRLVVQVSNWFINARVRIWKPMVEEIHTLETKGLAEPNASNHSLIHDHHDDRVALNKLPECPRNNSGALAEMEGNGPPTCQFATHDMDGSLVGVVPYRRNGGLGSVSLTLGLRQGAEQLQQQEHQLRRHFGGQLIHDFVG